MRKGIFAALAFMLFSLICQGQQTGWEKWSGLIGKWTGEGAGQPGVGGGTFSFAFDLDRNILVRKSHSEYPATADKAAIIHNDLMIIYPSANGIPNKAVYFDNEGHTIFYTVSFDDNSIIMTSDKAPGQPLFRLTYTYIDKTKVNVQFAMSQDGTNFRTYVEGISTRNK